ncbi:MAG: xylulokinase [Rhizobiaceae bacterium]
MYLGLDLGTSGVKALLIDEDQNVVASATDTMKVDRPHSGWSEQDPAEWMWATQEVMNKVADLRGGSLAEVRGIGLSGQMHGATLLDQDGAVLRPCMLWNDTRSHAEAAAMDDDPRFRAITGNIVFPGFTAPKVEWVRVNEPEIFDHLAMVLLPKDYLRFWLTGEFVSDMSDSAGTALFDTPKRDWSDELLAHCGLLRQQMPHLVEGCAPGGLLRDELAKRYGMKPGIPVAGGGGDNAASAIGMGIVAAGQAFVSLGTSGVLFAANDAYLPNPESAVHTFCHALPNTWHQMGVILSATDALNWYAGIAGASPDTLAGELGETLRTPAHAQFLPYLSGERTPHNDAAIRGAFVGLEHGHDRKVLTQAVLEGVAFALADNLAALRDTGTNLERVIAVGGGSRSSYWLKLIATALNITVDMPADGDYGAAFGAARLGLIAAENADPLSICTPPQISQSIEPDRTMTAAFSDAHERWRNLYPAIKGATP